MYRILFDTNALLDAALSDRPGHDAVVELVEWCNGGGDMGMASSLSFKDAYCILAKRYDEPTARTLVVKLMELLVVAPVTTEECGEAIRSNEPDFEDGLVRACAELNGADFIVTRDKAAFGKSRVRSMSAGELLDIVKSEDRGFSPWS